LSNNAGWSRGTMARDCEPYWALIFCDHLPDPMLRCPVLSRCAGTAFRITRNPCLCSPLGIGAGPILIAGCGGKLNASFSKKACRSGYNIWLILVCIGVFGFCWRRKAVSLPLKAFQRRRGLSWLVGLPHTLSYRFGPILFRKPKVIIGRVNAGTQPSSASVIGPPDQQFPVVTIHTVNASGIPNASGFNGSIEEVARGQIGVFVSSMKPQILLATTFVKLMRNWGHDFYVNHIDNDL